MLLPPEDCFKTPIALGYTGGPGHFSALVGVRQELQQVPLTDGQGGLQIR